MAKIAKYWNQEKDKTDWMNVEYKICSPFTPIEVFLQSACNTANPVLAHARDAWISIHKIFK